jgi:hypothetical protein
MKHKIDSKYSITKGGTVLNEWTGAILNQCISKTGYKVVSLHRKTTKLHRLLAIAFIPNPNNYTIINHIDGNKLNNELSNLEWCNHSHNLKHAYDIGLRKPTKGKSLGVEHGRSNLTSDDVLHIRDMHKEHKTQQEIADFYNCNRSIIQRIVTNKTYINI